MKTISSKSSKSLISTLVAMAVLPLIARAETFERELSREFDASSIESLDLSTGSGDVSVSSWDKPVIEVRVTMSVGAKSEEHANEIFDGSPTEFDQTGNQLKVKVQSNGYKSFFGLFRKSVRADVSVRCPKDLSVTVRTGSGDIVSNSVSGQLNFSTGSGNISGRDLSGELHASTGSGDVNLSDFVGSVSGDTGSGEIKVRNLEGDFNGGTGSGNIQVNGQISSFESETGSGSVSIKSSIPISSDSTAFTGSGSIDIVLPADSKFSITAAKGFGDIDCTFPMEIISQKKRSLRANVNGGGPDLQLVVGSGSVSISSQP